MSVTSTDPCNIVRRARREWSCECECHGRGGQRAEPHEGCTQTIPAGTQYVEYVGEAAAYQSGWRLCGTCAVITWGDYGVTGA